MLAAITFALGLALTGDVRAEELIDINRATAEELDRLPGIGKVKAQAIIRSREKDGPFRTVEDLVRVKGIGPATMRKLAPLVTVGPSKSPPPVAKKKPPPRPRKPSFAPGLDQESPEGKLNLNLATQAQLEELDGMTPAHAKVIVARRRVSGPYLSVAELASVPGLPASLVETMQYFVTTRVQAARVTDELLIELGFSAIAARSVVAGVRKGRIRSRADLATVEHLTNEERRRLEAMLWFAP